MKDDERWRVVGMAFRRWTLNGIRASLQERLEYGRVTHGERFKGDPLNHLDEELLDAIVYAAVIRRKIQALEEENTQLRTELAQIKAQKQFG